MGACRPGKSREIRGQPAPPGTAQPAPGTALSLPLGLKASSPCSALDQPGHWPSASGLLLPGRPGPASAAPRHPEQHRGPRAAPGPPLGLNLPALTPLPSPPPLPPPPLPLSLLTLSSGLLILWLPSLRLCPSVSLPLSVCLGLSVSLSLFLPSAALDLLSSATLGSPRAPLPRVSWGLWRRICSSSGGRATACLPGLSTHLGSSGRRVPVALAGRAGEDTALLGS